MERAPTNPEESASELLTTEIINTVIKVKFTKLFDNDFSLLLANSHFSYTNFKMKATKEARKIFTIESDMEI